MATPPCSSIASQSPAPDLTREAQPPHNTLCQGLGQHGPVGSPEVRMGTEGQVTHRAMHGDRSAQVSRQGRKGWGNPAF